MKHHLQAAGKVVDYYKLTTLCSTVGSRRLIWMCSKPIPSAWSYLQAFTKLVINRNTEVEHLLSFLSSPLPPNLKVSYSTQGTPLSVWPQLLNLLPQQYTVPDLRHFNFLLYFAKPRLWHQPAWQKLLLWLMCSAASFHLLADCRRQLFLSVTHCTDHTQVNHLCAACSTLLFPSPAP